MPAPTISNAAAGEYTPFAVNGDRDPFGAPAELERWTATVGGPVTHEWLTGGHDLKGKDAAVASVVAGWLRAL